MSNMEMPLNRIMVRGCVIEVFYIEHRLQSSDEEINDYIIKVLYLLPRNHQTFKSTLSRSRMVIHEMVAGNIDTYQSSFLWNIRDKEIEERILLSGYGGDLLFCLYKVDPLTSQRYFSGQCTIRLEMKRDSKRCHIYHTYLRDGKTCTKIGLKLDAEIFLPTKFEKIIESNIKTNDNKKVPVPSPTCSSLRSGNKHQGFRLFEISQGDIHSQVLARHRDTSLRRAGKNNLKLIEENERLQRRLGNI